MSATAEQAARKLFKATDTLLAQGSDHLFGTWCIADVDLALMLNRLVLNGDPVPRGWPTTRSASGSAPPCRRG